MSAVTKTLGTLMLALSVAPAAQAGPARRCVDESERLVGERATVVDAFFRAPRKLHHVSPDLPVREGAASVWLADVLVDQQGKVREVWTLRGFTPPWPEFDVAAASAIRQWTYEPAVVDGRPVPFCVPVAVKPRVR
jgi:TonB-like protein